jgi:hypothetical protein
VILKAFKLSAAFLPLVLWLAGCGQGGTVREGGFAGLGDGNVSTLGTEIKGTVQYNDFQGGKLVVEARSTFPCPQGRCPVIEKAPLGQVRLDAPGPFSLLLKDREENILVIANYFSDTGRTRVAYQLLKDPQASYSDVLLSLDRPYGPLR